MPRLINVAEAAFLGGRLVPADRKALMEKNRNAKRKKLVAKKKTQTSKKAK